jgi:hypothetical protein
LKIGKCQKLECSHLLVGMPFRLINIIERLMTEQNCSAPIVASAVIDADLETSAFYVLLCTGDFAVNFLSLARPHVMLCHLQDCLPTPPATQSYVAIRRDKIHSDC